MWKKWFPYLQGFFAAFGVFALGFVAAKQLPKLDPEYNALDPSTRKVELKDYRGKMRWICNNPECPEGCAELIREMGEAELKKLQE